MNHARLLQAVPSTDSSKRASSEAEVASLFLFNRVSSAVVISLNRRPAKLSGLSMGVRRSALFV